MLAVLHLGLGVAPPRRPSPFPNWAGPRQHENMRPSCEPHEKSLAAGHGILYQLLSFAALLPLPLPFFTSRTLSFFVSTILASIRTTETTSQYTKLNVCITISLILFLSVTRVFLGPLRLCLGNQHSTGRRKHCLLETRHTASPVCPTHSPNTSTHLAS